VPDRVVNAAWPPRHIDLDQRGLNWLTTVATREAWRQGSTARELPAGAFIAAALATGAGELPEPAGPAGDPADLALARDEHTQRVGQLQALKPREREALYLQRLGHSYHAIAELSGVRAVVDECLARLVRWRHLWRSITSVRSTARRKGRLRSGIAAGHPPDLMYRRVGR
jgi:hypothetical protein